jgi:heme exporter protein B
MTPGHAAKATFWLILKDLAVEFRLRRAWPAMLFLGIVLVICLVLQIDLPGTQRQQVVCGMLWVAVFFAGTLALERSFAGEREEGCWRTLMAYPLSPTSVLVAKMAVNFMALALLECVLVPAFVVFADVPLLARPLPLLVVAALANLGFVAVGVLVSAATAGLSHRSSLLTLLQLPLMTPVILAAAEATRLLSADGLDETEWRWIKLLAAFAVLFVTLGLLVFEFVAEE